MPLEKNFAYRLFQERRNPCYPKINERYLPISTTQLMPKGLLMKKRHI